MDTFELSYLVSKRTNLAKAEKNISLAVAPKQNREQWTVDNTQLQFWRGLGSVLIAIRTMSLADAKAYFVDEQEERWPDCNLTILLESFSHWFLKPDITNQLLVRAPTAPPAEQLWEAISAWEPWPGGSNSSSDTVLTLISDSGLDFVPLGKLKGRNILCALKPAKGCLAPITETGSLPNLGLERSDTPTTAISYGKASSYGVKIIEDVGPMLRRFVPLGWLMISDFTEAQGRWDPSHYWEMSGHVLVIDADRGRECHPWLVLANEWESDDSSDWEDRERIIRPPKRVGKNYDEARGVFPNDLNRTTITRLEHCGGFHPATPFLKQFGPDFEFVLTGTCPGYLKWSDTDDIDSDNLSERGPDLAEIMHWYWLDSEESMEICFNEAGEEYMRYDPRTAQYIMGRNSVSQARIQAMVDDIQGSICLGAGFRGLSLES